MNWSSGMPCSISHTWQLRLHCPYNDLIPRRHAKQTSSMYLACLHRMTPNDAFHKASDLLLCHQCFQILPKSHRGEWRLEFTFSIPPLQYCLPLNFPQGLIFKLTFCSLWEGRISNGMHSHPHFVCSRRDAILRASDAKNPINAGNLLAINTTPETSEPPASLLPSQAWNKWFYFSHHAAPEKLDLKKSVLLKLSKPDSSNKIITTVLFESR